MATNNSVNTSLSGQTGTGAFAGSTSPTFVTPTLGVATATSLAFNPSTGGIIGTTTNNNATTGIVGEYVTSQVLLASAISLTSGADANVTTISLTAGDWWVVGNVTFTIGAALGTTQYCWVSSTSATLPDFSLRGALTSASNNLFSNSIVTPPVRFSLASTTTIYLSVRAAFGATTQTACGGIFARRIR